MNKGLYTLGEYYAIIFSANCLAELIEITKVLLYLRNQKMIGSFEQMVLSSYIEKKERNLKYLNE